MYQPHSDHLYWPHTDSSTCSLESPWFERHLMLTLLFWKPTFLKLFSRPMPLWNNEVWLYYFVSTTANRTGNLVKSLKSAKTPLVSDDTGAREGLGHSTSISRPTIFFYLWTSGIDTASLLILISCIRRDGGNSPPRHQYNAIKKTCNDTVRWASKYWH